MTALGPLRTLIHRRRLRRRRESTFQQLVGYTMIPRETYFDNLQLAEQVAHIPGCVVECGVWRGGMIAGLVSVLGPSRRYYLFDSFAGLPPATEIDGPAALAWQKNPDGQHYHDNCSAAPHHAEQAMRLAGAQSYTLVPGWFNTTVPTFVPPEPIALLRLDGDWYDSTLTCLEGLFHHLAPGGLLLIDDYYTWDGCSRAVHDFLSRTHATERIASFNTVCYIRKNSPPPRSGV
jgi:O-methyltransferase